MSIELENLRYVGLAEEADGAYGVDQSGTPSNYLPFPYQEGGLALDGDRAPLDPRTGKIRADGHDKGVLGPRRCSGSIATVLHSHGLDLDGDVAPPTTANFPLLRAMKISMGGSRATGTEAGQTTVQAGSTTTAIVVDAGHGDRFQPGDAIGVPVVSGSPNLEAAVVHSVATDTITLKSALSAAPVTGQPVRGSVMTYLTERPLTHMQFLKKGREDSDATVFAGMNGGFSVEIPINELGTITFDLQGSYWAELGASNVTIPAYSNFNPLLCLPVKVVVSTVGSAQARVELEESAVTFEPQITYAPQISGRAAEGIARMIRQSARPVVQGTFTVPFEDLTWYTARDNREDRSVFIQCGDLAGGIVCFEAPTVQITDVKRAPVETGVSGHIVSWQGRHDEAIGGTTEESYSAFRVFYL